MGIRQSLAIIIVLFLSVSLEARDLSYYKKQLIDKDSYQSKVSSGTTVNWPVHIGVQQTSNLNAAFTDFGQFGNEYIGDNFIDTSFPNASFESPPGSGLEYLYGGAIWVGAIVGEDTLVSTGADGWGNGATELRSITYPSGSIYKVESSADFSMRYTANDTITDGPILDASGRPHIPLNIEVALSSHVWQGYPDIIIYDMIIANIGNESINEAYIGFIFDCDITHSSNYGYDDDLSGSIREHGIAYSFDNNGDPNGSTFNAQSPTKAFAFKLLSSSHIFTDTNFNWWLSNGNPLLDFGPRKKGTFEDPFRVFRTNTLGTPEGDADKYYMMSHREWDYDQILMGIIEDVDSSWIPFPDIVPDFNNNSDIKFLFSLGPTVIEVDSSIRVVFSTFINEGFHTVINNFDNFPQNPEQYLANVNIDQIILNGNLASQLALELTDPLNPVNGLRVTQQSFDSVSIKWQPFIFPEVTGYNIYLSKIDETDLPYPGIFPPWLLLPSDNLYEELNILNFYNFYNLDSNSFYTANVANRTNGYVGDNFTTTHFNTRPDINPVQIDTLSRFFIENQPLTLEWIASNDLFIDHYNIYKFENIDSLLASRYNRFYDLGEMQDVHTPVNSLLVIDTMYYYYAITPYAQVDALELSFIDNNPVDSSYYVVTAVDHKGIESDILTKTAMAQMISAPTKDFLVLTNNYYFLEENYNDSIASFYRQVLFDYTFDIFIYYDTKSTYGYPHGDTVFNLNLYDLTKYKYIINDEVISNYFINERNRNSRKKISDYILTGGKFIHFGDFSGLLSPFGIIDIDSGYYNDYYTARNFSNEIFNIDSAYFYSPMFYYETENIAIKDTVFGFNYAEPVNNNLPLLEYNENRSYYVFGSMDIWFPETPPTVTTFKLKEGAEPLYTYRSLYPETSVLEGEVVGLRTKTDEIETYAFGFHLWYMDVEPARQLIDYIYNGIPTDVVIPNDDLLPDKFALHQNYPNPFNPSTVIAFNLPKKMTVTLDIINILGQTVVTLIDDNTMKAGIHEIEWNGTGSNGNSLSSGLYFYRLKADDNISTKKMMLIK